MGLISLVLIDMVTIDERAMVEVAESVRDTSKYRRCGINMAVGIFSALESRINMTDE